MPHSFLSFDLYGRYILPMSLFANILHDFILGKCLVEKKKGLIFIIYNQSVDSTFDR